MREKQRIKPTPEEYAAEIADEMRKGNPGKAEWLSTRFDRDYPPEADA